MSSQRCHVAPPTTHTLHTSHVAISLPPPPSHQETEAAAAGARDAKRLEPQVCFLHVLFYSTNVYLDYFTFMSDNNHEQRQRRTVIQQQQGLETRHVSGPRYVFFSLFLSFTLMTFHHQTLLLSNQTQKASRGPRQPRRPMMANDSQHKPTQTQKLENAVAAGGLETRNVSSPRYVSFYIYFIHSDNNLQTLPQAMKTQCRPRTPNAGQRGPSAYSSHCQPENPGMGSNDVFEHRYV